MAVLTGDEGVGCCRSEMFFLGCMWAPKVWTNFDSYMHHGGVDPMP